MPVPSIMPRSTSRMPAMPSSTIRQASTSALSPKRSTIDSSARWAASGVLIETPPRLGAQVALLDQLLGAAVHVEAVAVGLAHVLGDLQGRVEARHVAAPERAHGHAGLLLDELAVPLRG